ncbi:hypothetical protein OVS_01280 [Mycoplasma ovis str. Michigan]|uniref:Uncharacterized protein n=1 Tax=Mycoplasma ovis str. Michigan TaxID=1415773 RepID=A0ABM5P1K9_9MOLU|nr:hypothetical protein OVS_01280 [Mycoplasma ovis str. Michigan]
MKGGIRSRRSILSKLRGFNSFDNTMELRESNMGIND